MTSSTNARVLRASPGLIVGAVQNLCVVVWREAPTITLSDYLGLEYARMRSEHPRGFAPLIIVEDGVGIPDERARKRLAELMDYQGKAMLCMAGVQEASGFRGAAIRSVLTAINTLSTAPYPRKIFATVEQSAEWLAGHAATAVTRDALTPLAIVRGVLSVRREADAKSTSARPRA